MAGNNTIRGDETVTFTDNLSFDGTERGGKLDTDGQLWLGSASSPHVRKASLSSSDSSITLTYSEPTSTTASLDVSINGPVNVDTGGTGRASHIAYSPICGGTTTTSAQQSVASVGTSGQVLTSNGAGALPTFQTAGGGSGGNLVYLSSLTASSSASLDFTSNIDTTYNTYYFIIENLTVTGSSNTLYARTSSDGGSTWDSGATDYSYSSIRRTSTASSQQSNGNTEINTYASLEAGAEDYCSGVVIMTGAAQSSYTFFNFHLGITDSTKSGMVLCGASRKSATAVDAVQFFTSSSNIEAGKITMYGMTTPS